MQSRRRARRARLMYRLPEFDAPRPLSEVVPGGDSRARELRALAASAHAGRHNHEGARAAGAAGNSYGNTTTTAAPARTRRERSRELERHAQIIANFRHVLESTTWVRTGFTP